MTPYARLAAMAKELGCPVRDLLVLAPVNDPFYMGSPAQRRQAEWFADLWERYGYTSGVHLRRIHYRLVNDDPPARLHDGTLYLNDNKCWGKLCTAAKYARYLKLVAFDDFVDRRNPAPIINVSGEEPDPRIELEIPWWERIEIPELPEPPGFKVDGFHGRQRYHLEVWIEKSTMNDVLEPICKRYGANLSYSLGEQSIPVTWAMSRRIKEDGRPARVFYISDFDPAGQSMPVAAARKLEYALAEQEVDLDVRLFHLALTPEQVQQYDLPRAPIKDAKDGASTRGRAIWNGRKRKFEERYGEGAVELDALEGLHEGTLGAIAAKALSTYYDRGLGSKVMKAQSGLWERLEEVHGEVVEKYAARWVLLEAEHARLTDEFADRAGDLDQRYHDLVEAMTEDLGSSKPLLDDHPIPEPAEAEEFGEPLFSTDRDFTEQIRHYHAFQGRDE